MPNVNMINFGAGQSGSADLQAQQIALQHRQQLVDMLRKQAMEPSQTQVISGRAVPVSPLETLAKLATAYLSNRTAEGLDSKSVALGEAQRKRQAEALRALAPAEAGFDMTPKVPAGASPDTATGFTPPQPPTVDPETRARWVRMLAATEANPKLGEKLLEQEFSQPKWSTSPHYDQQGRAFILSDKGGKPQYIDGVSARDKMENVNGVWQNPYSQKENSFAPQDPNKPFGMGPQGVVPNLPYQAYTERTAKAGAYNIVNKTDVKVAESIAGQVGQILKESTIAAQGALSQIDAAQRVVLAAQSNKIFAGPLASKRMTIAQLGETFGFGGKDNSEKIANTRQAIRGFAELTLQGRKTMRGEGAITEQEGKLAERAMSGNIDELTPAEMIMLAKASERSARHVVSEHKRKVRITKSNPATAGIAGYFDAEPIGGDGWSITPVPAGK